jgi:hypothetical protein
MCLVYLIRGPAKPCSGGIKHTGVDVYIKTADFRSAFAGDAPAATTKLMAITQRPVTMAAAAAAVQASPPGRPSPPGTW